MPRKDLSMIALSFFLTRCFFNMYTFTNVYSFFTSFSLSYFAINSVSSSALVDGSGFHPLVRGFLNWFW